MLSGIRSIAETWIRRATGVPPVDKSEGSELTSGHKNPTREREEDSSRRRAKGGRHTVYDAKAKKQDAGDPHGTLDVEG